MTGPATKTGPVTRAASAGGAEWFARSFEELARQRNGGDHPDLHALRRASIDRFGALGFPTRGDEEWRFTPVASHLSLPYELPRRPGVDGLTREGIDRMAVRGLPGYRFVFVDGHLAPELSALPSGGNGLRAGSLRAMTAPGAAGAAGRIERLLRTAAADDRDPFLALNGAFLGDGLCLEVEEGYEETLPVYVLYLSSGAPGPFVTHPRNLIVAGPGSRVAVVEEYVGAGAGRYFTNSATGIFAGRGASVEFDRFQHEGEGALHVSTVAIRQEAESAVTVTTVGYGAALARQNVLSILGGERAECTLNGLTLTTGTQHIDNHTTIDHATPNCSSHELYKAILEGASRGVFNGKIFVRRDAQKTDARQTNKTLLLSDDATIDTKPQLEIFADDVKCTHGATVGQLDEEQLFYLRSRGMGLDDARDLLTNAFASDVLNRIRLEPLREHLQAILHVRLCKGRLGAGAR